MEKRSVIPKLRHLPQTIKHSNIFPMKFAKKIEFLQSHKQRHYRMKIKLIFILMLLGIKTLANGRECMVLYLKDGGKVVWQIKEEPKITFRNSTISIGTAHYEISNIRKYTFEDADDTAIENVESEQSGKTYYFNEESLTVRFNGDAKDVKIYETNGREVAAPVVHETNGLLHIDMSGLPSGVYLLRIGNEEAVKIWKK